MKLLDILFESVVDLNEMPSKLTDDDVKDQLDNLNSTYDFSNVEIERTKNSKVVIKNDVLIGTGCSIIDNDGHNLAIEKRNFGTPKTAPIHIHQNVFLGSNVTILKGVTIGKNSIIGNGSVVTKNIPENVIAAGNPAKVIRNL